MGLHLRKWDSISTYRINKQIVKISSIEIKYYNSQVFIIEMASR